MTGLLLSEIRRFTSRRLVWFLTGLSALAIVVSATIVFLTQEFELRSLPDVLIGTSLVLASMGLVLGASAIGADWHTGHMTTILTWEPRRVRVLVAKVAACVLLVFLLSLALQALLAATLAVDAAARGSTAGAEGWLPEAAGVAVRTSLLTTIFSGVGFALASVGRNSAVALGVVFGPLVPVENIVRVLRPQWTPWLLTENAGMLILASPGDFPGLDRSTLGAGAYLAAVAVALLLGAAAVFRARDVQ